MDGWTCPACGRLFARRTAHDCSPGLDLEEYFATGPAHERPVVDAVLDVLAERAGPVHVDCVSVGLFLKNPEKFAELRPMARWVAASFWLPRRATHPTITRKVNRYGDRYWHTANLATPADVDAALADLLVESYDAALDTA